MSQKSTTYLPPIKLTETDRAKIRAIRAEQRAKRAAGLRLYLYRQKSGRMVGEWI